MHRWKAFQKTAALSGVHVAFTGVSVSLFTNGSFRRQQLSYSHEVVPDLPYLTVQRLRCFLLSLCPCILRCSDFGVSFVSRPPCPLGCIVFGVSFVSRPPCPLGCSVFGVSFVSCPPCPSVMVQCLWCVFCFLSSLPLSYGAVTSGFPLLLVIPAFRRAKYLPTPFNRPEQITSLCYRKVTIYYDDCRSLMFVSFSDRFPMPCVFLQL